MELYKMDCNRAAHTYQNYIIFGRKQSKYVQVDSAGIFLHSRYIVIQYSAANFQHSR